MVCTHIKGNLLILSQMILYKYLHFIEISKRWHGANITTRKWVLKFFLTGKFKLAYSGCLFQEVKIYLLSSMGLSNLNLRKKGYRENNKYIRNEMGCSMLSS